MCSTTNCSNSPNGGILASKEVSKVRRCLTQIIAVSVKNVLLLIYGLTMGMPTMLIPNLAGGIPGESIILNDEGISWIGEFFFYFIFWPCL